MRLLTFQPLSVLKLLQKGKEYRSDCLRDYSECSAENIALKSLIKFSPIWCIPLFDDVQTVYNIMRCSPSFPQAAIVFEKDFEGIQFIDYVKYSQCLRAQKSYSSDKVDFTSCLANNCEDYFKMNSSYYECVVPRIRPDELRKFDIISESDYVEKIHSDLLDYEIENTSRFNDLIGLKFKLFWPKDIMKEAKMHIAWRALTWHKLVDYSEITEDTTRYSLEQFKQYCIEFEI